MPRIARATCRKLDHYPWIDWIETFEWEDDEFQGREHASTQGKLHEKADINMQECDSWKLGGSSSILCD